LSIRAQILEDIKPMDKWSRLNEELARILQSLKEDPTNIELANRYWATLAEGDYRSGAYVIEAYREAALASNAGAAAFARAYRELCWRSGEGPRRFFFDDRLVQALQAYLPQLAGEDYSNVEWVLQSLADGYFEVDGYTH